MLKQLKLMMKMEWKNPKYFGRADVKLNQLSLSMKISIPINEIKVLGIFNSMQKQFDPSLVNFTVYPADPDTFDAAKLDSFAESLEGSSVVGSAAGAAHLPGEDLQVHGQAQGEGVKALQKKMEFESKRRSSESVHSNQ